MYALRKAPGATPELWAIGARGRSPLPSCGTELRWPNQLRGDGGEAGAVWGADGSPAGKVLRRRVQASWAQGVSHYITLQRVFSGP